MLTAYYDESGSHDPADVICLAGWVSSDTRWRRFDTDWGPIIRSAKVREYKATDWAGRRKDYKGWNDQKCDRHFAQLTSVIFKRARLGVSTCVIRSAYRAAIESWAHKSNPYRDPYVFCLQTWMQEINDSPFIRTEDTVAIVFDKGHGRTKPGKVANLFEMLKRKHPDKFSRFTTITPADSRDVYALQASDLLAYEMARHHTTVVVRGDRIQRKEMTRLRDGVKHPLRSLYYDLDNLNQMLPLLAVQRIGRAVSERW